MPRRLALTAAFIMSIAIAACQGAAAVPALTDPTEILAKSVEALAKAKSVHFDVAVTGTFNADVMGTGTESEFKLDGTTANGDLDVAGKKFRAAFSVPALLGLSGELIQIGQTSYVKSSLTGTKYQKSTSTDVPVDEVTDPAKGVAELRKVLEMPGISPTKVADAKCGDNKDCYQVEIDLTGEELAALASDAPDVPTDLSEGSLKVTFGVEKDTLRMSKIVVAVSAGAQGSVDLTVNMTKWDEAVTISEPPADQVEEGSGF